MTQVKVVMVTELTFDVGQRSSRAWIENDVIPPITEEVKERAYNTLKGLFDNSGKATLVAVESKVMVPA